MKNKLILLFTLSLFLGCGVTKSKKKDNKNNSKTVLNYLDKTAELMDVPKSEFYYASTKSDSNFVKKMQPSILTFIKGNRSATVDSLQLPENRNIKGLNSSCGVKDITKKIIQYNLKKHKSVDYGSIVMKNMQSHKMYDFPKDKIVSLLLYTNKMGILAKQYFDTVKRLKKDYGIDYLILTMDGQELKDIDDIYYDSFDNKTQVEIN